MLRKFFGCLLLIILTSTYSQSQIIDTVGNTVVRIDSLLGFTNTAIDWPWDLHWGGDDQLWFTVGNKICTYDTVLHSVDTVYKKTNTEFSNSMSVVTHPNFPTTPVVFATFDTTSTYYGGGTRILLYKYDYSVSGDSLYNETEILSWWHGGEHSGGRLTIGVDNYLYVTTAEYWHESDTAGNLSGKILRVNLDGTVPLINTSGTYAISYGHRNPQGIVQVPNGNVIVSELGQVIDELNLIEEYKDFGWPVYDYDQCTNIYPDSCTSPTYSHVLPIDTAIRPPSGIDYYDHVAIPEFQGCVLQCIISFGGWQGGLVASQLNAAMDDVINDVHYFRGEYLRFRDCAVSPDGKVFVITNDRTEPVIRVIYNPNYHQNIEEPQSNLFTLYPNPAANFIEISSTLEIGHWQMISIDGKVVKQGVIDNLEGRINIVDIPAGVYFLTTELGVKKFIKY